METDPKKPDRSGQQPAPESSQPLDDYPQWLYVETIHDEKCQDIRGSGENVDDYWADAWSLSFCEARRSNFDEYRGRYEKAFPTRYRLGEFRLGRSMRRVLAKNKDLRTVVRPLRITPAKESLHLEHHLFRFKTPPKETLSKRYEYIVHHPARLMEMCFFDEERLIAFSIFEVGEKAISSNTGVWSPREWRRGLGTLRS